MPLDEQYWSNRYLSNDTGWDAGTVTSPLKEYISQLTDKNISILIPGCGNGHEAAFLLQHGFTHITLVDISLVLCSQLQQQFKDAPPGLQIICADFFEHRGGYDLILEQTFFCALDPSLRKDYAAKMQQLLKPAGKLVGLLFNKHFESGPPFGGDEAGYRRLLEPFFTISTMEPCYNSIGPRVDAELFINLSRKPG